MLSEELLKQAAEELALALIESLPEPEQCQHLLNKISKNQYVANADIREAISTVFEHFENHIFYDIALKSYVKFDYQDEKLVVTPI